MKPPHVTPASVLNRKRLRAGLLQSINHHHPMSENFPPLCPPPPPPSSLRSPPMEEKHHFFKVLMPGFEHKLKIPPAFKKHIFDDNHGKGTIQSPLGISWYVEFLEEEGSIYMGEGWSEFVQSHELAIGYFLVFCYEGDMIFTVDIFDHTACLKEYTPIVQKGEKKKANFLDPTAVAPSKAYKRRIAVKNKPMKANNLVRNLTNRNISFSVKKPDQFEKIIQLTHYHRGFLDLPKQFCEINGLLSHTEVILEDPKGRQWPVNFCPAASAYYFCKGWRQFLMGNAMKVGSRCILKLISKGKKKLMRVQIFKK